MSNNIFDNLEEVVDDKTTNNVSRKAKKKLREIEALKRKSILCEEEIRKIQLEEYWQSFFPKKKLHPINRFGITHAVNSVNHNDDIVIECPICLSDVPRGCVINTNCNHSYCANCFDGLIRTAFCGLRCSLCRTNITRLVFQNEYDMIDIMNSLHFKKR
jgi:hypothetical protein